MPTEHSRVQLSALRAAAVACALCSLRVLPYSSALSLAPNMPRKSSKLAAGERKPRHKQQAGPPATDAWIVGGESKDREHLPPANKSPISTLYAHALASVFAFLPIGGLHRVMGVSKGWKAAVLSMPPIGARVVRLRSTPRSAVLQSHLFHHVTSLNTVSPLSSLFDGQFDPESPASLELRELRDLCKRWPQLTELITQLEFAHPKAGAARIEFPPGLRTLDLEFSGDRDANLVFTPECDPWMASAMSGIGRLQQLRTLTLRCKGSNNPIPLEPLLSAPMLRRFTMRAEPLVNSQLDVIKKMPLEELEMDRIWFREWPAVYERLFSNGPHKMQLQRLPTPHHDTDFLAVGALACNATLTDLSCGLMQGGKMRDVTPALMRQLHKLRSVTMPVNAETEAAAAEIGAALDSPRTSPASRSSAASATFRQLCCGRFVTCSRSSSPVNRICLASASARICIARCALCRSRRATATTCARTQRMMCSTFCTSML